MIGGQGLYACALMTRGAWGRDIYVVYIVSRESCCKGVGLGVLAMNTPLFFVFLRCSKFDFLLRRIFVLFWMHMVESDRLAIVRLGERGGS
jgi:hypothetical protein